MSSKCYICKRTFSRRSAYSQHVQVCLKTVPDEESSNDSEMDTQDTNDEEFNNVKLDTQNNEEFEMDNMSLDSIESTQAN